MPGRFANLFLRSATAVVGIPAVLLIDFTGGPIFAAALAVAAAIGAMEFYQMMRRAHFRPLAAIGVPVTALIPILPFFHANAQAAWVGITVFFLGGSAVYYLRPEVFASSLLNWLMTMTPLLYVGILIGHLGLLRQLNHGAWWVLVVLVCTWAYDTGAYLAGSLVGRRHFMAHVSPSKTVEGVQGGLFLACLAGLVAVPSIGLAAWQALALGLGIGVAAQVGDLVESMIKRQTGVKDSGVIVPGHGGLLDRVDSLLFTGALAYYAAALLGHAS